jgi:hypothetical protein
MERGQHLLQRLELTARLAGALELDFAAYLLNVTMLEILNRGTHNPPSGQERRRKLSARGVAAGSLTEASTSATS